MNVRPGTSLGNESQSTSNMDKGLWAEVKSRKIALIVGLLPFSSVLR